MSGFHSSAPLTGALLASKGAAAPSRSVSSFMEGLADETATPANPAPTTRESPAPAAALQKSFERVKEQDDTASPSSEQMEIKPPAQKGRIKLSLRLEEEQHLRLKLAAAHLRQSSQTILLAALDDYLNRHVPDIRSGDCNCLMTRNKDRETSHMHYGEPYGNAD